jgi:hypothetical protein
MKGQMKEAMQAIKALTEADGVQILGAVYLALCGAVCTSLSEMHANHAAQGTVSKLRYELWRKTYGRGL